MSCRPEPDGDDDGDELGNACDFGRQSIFLFDGFGALGDDWLEEGPRWASANDRVGPDPDLANSPYYLQHERKLATASWYIELGIVTPTILANKFGLNTNLMHPSCTLRKTGDATYDLIVNEIAQVTINESLPEEVALRMTVTGTNVECALAGTPHEITRPLTVSYPLSIRLSAERASNRFTYILVAE